MKLSILIPTLPSRADLFNPLVDKLEGQIKGGGPVEIIGLLDNKTQSVGEKRNHLLSMAKGEFITFIDDDDDVPPDYVITVLEALRRRPQLDLLMYNVEVQYVQEQPKGRHQRILCRYEIGREVGTEPTKGEYWGPPAHTHVWRTELVRDVSFLDQNYGEDSDWARRAKKGVKDWDNIDRVLYYYKFDQRRTETR